MSKPDRVIGLAPSPAGFFAVSADGKLFQRVRDPKNFDGRNPDQWIWREYTTPGPVEQVTVSPKGELILLLKDGRVVERERDKANIVVPHWVWKDIPSPLPPPPSLDPLA